MGILGVSFLPPDTLAIFIGGSCGVFFVMYVWIKSINQRKK